MVTIAGVSRASSCTFFRACWRRSRSASIAACSYSMVRATQTGTLRSSLSKGGMMFSFMALDHPSFFEADPSQRLGAVAYDDMVKKVYSDDLPGLMQPLRYPGVLHAGRGIAGRVIVPYDEGSGVTKDRRLKDFPRMDDGAIQDADRDGGNADHLVLGVEEDRNEVLPVHALQVVGKEPGNVFRVADDGPISQGEGSFPHQLAAVDGHLVAEYKLCLAHIGSSSKASGSVYQGLLPRMAHKRKWGSQPGNRRSRLSQAAS